MFWNIFGQKKIGLVLGGGVARGIAHIGVLKVFEQHKIPIAAIAGTSSGAIIGAAYAAGLEVRIIEEIALRISWGKFIRVAFFRPGIITGAAIEDFLVKYIGDKQFSDLKIPLAVVATNLKTGEPEVLKQGKVAKAVAASSAFPGVFVPEDIKYNFLVDGGISNNLPVDVARKMKTNFVVAVDVVPAKTDDARPKDPMQVFGRSLDIVLHRLSQEQRKAADILIEPSFDQDVWHLDLGKAKQLIKAGEVAAQAVVNRLKRILF
ncbi:hypothetical protein A2291_06840 [candidate division WOR-1 bacterium RIFOXYB2_FULL_42_35]|uniref:PNPLA domain-containing protein n=1 Tax=candidate division WOR-1 bacterium RIFOXYC2_FULL_41_25 TaxID=1802586 RepID=A0A1F4TPK1_UNCSA|nr:MAG: hypothetical protein A2291_06840 [candidate division WOR-1 bacterium RIFOXYB2_FULL_42_35]OGC24595.1 MAG: hypothetical protein A2247_06620 [candidate division WOR-1 bacterium RIFOXYA2_FULL_41_14]OGC34641.1 MAG: hypothetical protein A2462_04855 [candidate division WOR-1 bacterium RIFOXYC2_FULL_41_25]OGC43310.1 MAG: hypothetical protein A2548_07600 [candidate division WOR-1 bacterium RIFOXYD2_FULL_41_8]